MSLNSNPNPNCQAKTLTVHLIDLLNETMIAILACYLADFEDTVKINKITNKVLIEKAFDVTYDHWWKYNDAWLEIKSVE